MDLTDAILVSKNALKNVYAPYSNYLVGAALVCKSRKNLFWL